MHDRTIALAGVCQAATYIKQIARKNDQTNSELEPLLRSVLNTAPNSTIDVYGGIENLELGLHSIINQLASDKGYKDGELTRYIVSMLSMERKISKDKNALAELAKRISQVDRQLQHFAVTDDTIIGSLASIYSDVISPLGPKIQIAGSPAILKQVSNQHKVRAMLLAGIRSAVLWRQLGGKRRHMIFKRTDILKSAQQLLQQL